MLYLIGSMLFDSDYLEHSHLAHYGIKGQKKGVRRYQNPDGTLTAEGYRRYGYEDGSTKKFSNAGDFIGVALKKSSPSYANTYKGLPVHDGYYVDPRTHATMKVPTKNSAASRTATMTIKGTSGKEDETKTEETKKTEAAAMESKTNQNGTETESAKKGTSNKKKANKAASNEKAEIGSISSKSGSEIVDAVKSFTDDSLSEEDISELAKSLTNGDTTKMMDALASLSALQKAVTPEGNFNMPQTAYEQLVQTVTENCPGIPIDEILELMKG